MKRFDKKFGASFIAEVPLGPGVYRMFNSQGELIYVGKAKNLRRRLSQYRNAKRRKKHFKMRAIVAEATEIQIDLHESEWAACVSETLIIQNLKPKWNVAGAFYFLYPLMAVGYVDGEMEFLYTTEPESINSEVASRLDFHGAFRSRFLCGRAFFSLMELLEFIGHKNKTRKFGKYTYLYSFRQIDESWKSDLNLFFRGESQDFFEKLILKLVESSSARRRPKEVQKCLNDLKSFWRHEACLLKRVRKFASEPKYPIPQKERDFLFIKYRYGATSIPIDGGWVAQ